MQISKVPVKEDDYWLFFGYGKGWGDKCDRCFNHLKLYRHALRSRHAVFLHHHFAVTLNFPSTLSTLNSA